jgi:hypothetical protein
MCIIHLEGIPYRALAPCYFECLVLPVALGRDERGWFLSAAGRFEAPVRDRATGATIVAASIREAGL